MWNSVLGTYICMFVCMFANLYYVYVYMVNMFVLWEKSSKYVLWSVSVLCVCECMPWKEERSEELKKESVCELLMICVNMWVGVFTSWGKWVGCEWRSGVKEKIVSECNGWTCLSGF
jgi:hypothetical protein